VETEVTMKPPQFTLTPNAPNPFNPMTTIRFEVDRPGLTTLRVYAVNGSLVRTLASGTLPAGGYRVTWDGRDERGRAVASGLYIYRLESGGRHLAAKMSLLR
jgi:flagellar hook assembly protein FlgD